MKWLIGCFMLFGALHAGEIDRVQEVYFTSDQPIEKHLIRWIDRETESIRIAMYSLMHGGISRAIQRAHKRGVDVEVLVDSYSVKSRSPLKKMAALGIPVYVWEPPINNKKGRMHHKFCVFGNHTVWTGSLNFTREASSSNRENVVVMQGERVVQEFLGEYQLLKHEGGRGYAEFTTKKTH